MPRSSFEGKIWSRTTLSSLHARTPIRRVLDVGAGAGAYTKFREAGQHWTAVEAWQPYIDQYSLRTLYDDVISADVRKLDWTARGALDLVICGDVLEHMSKDAALSVLKCALQHSRYVLVSIPIVYSEQGEAHGNPFEVHVKPDWTHEECLESLPDVCVHHVEDTIGVYVLSRNAEDRQVLLDVHASLRATEGKLTPIGARVSQYKTAMAKAPYDINLLQEFCYRCATDDVDSVVAVLEEVWRRNDPDPGLRLQQSALRASFTNGQRRDRLGLSSTHAAGLSDLHFSQAAVEVQEWQALARARHAAKPASVPSLRMQVLALMAGGLVDKAAPFITALRDQGRQDLETYAYFEPSFHASLVNEIDGTLERLPPFEVHRSLTRPCDAVVFAAADVTYLQRYGWSMIASLARHRDRDIALALHVFDATPTEVSEIIRRLERYDGLSFSVSAEVTGLRNPDSNTPSSHATSYYHAARFIRLHQVASQYAHTPIWQVDCDILFNKSPRFFPSLSDSDVALWLAPGRLEVSNQVCAGLVGVSPSEKGRMFLRHVASYLGVMMTTRGLPWGIDQIALFAVLNDLRQRLSPFSVCPIPPEIGGVNFGPSDVLWPGKITPDHPDFARVAQVLDELEPEENA